MSVDKKTILFKDVSETFEDKLIRIIFIKLLQKLFGSREMCDLIRKFHGVKFARDTRRQSPEIQGEIIAQTLRGNYR